MSSGRTLNGLSPFANDILGSCLLKQNNFIDVLNKPLALQNIGFTGNIPSVYKSGSSNATPNTLVAYDTNGNVSGNSLNLISTHATTYAYDPYISLTNVAGNSRYIISATQWRDLLFGDRINNIDFMFYQLSTQSLTLQGNYLKLNHNTIKNSAGITSLTFDTSGNISTSQNITANQYTGNINSDSIQSKTTSAKVSFSSPIAMDNNTMTIYCNSFNTYENRNTQVDATYSIGFNNNLLVNISSLTSSTVKTNSITTTPTGTDITFNGKNLISVGAITCSSLSTSSITSVGAITCSSLSTSSITSVGSISSSGINITDVFASINLNATSGRQFFVYSTGPGNSGGAGKFVIYDQTGNRNIFRIDATLSTPLTTIDSISTTSITSGSSGISFNSKDLTSVGDITCSSITSTGQVKASNVWRTIWSQSITTSTSTLNNMTPVATYTTYASGSFLTGYRVAASFYYTGETKLTFAAWMKTDNANLQSINVSIEVFQNLGQSLSSTGLSATTIVNSGAQFASTRLLTVNINTLTLNTLYTAIIKDSSLFSGDTWFMSGGEIRVGFI